VAKRKPTREGTATNSTPAKAAATRKGRGKAKATRRKTPRGAAAPAAPAEVAPRWVVTTIRIEHKHWQALRMAALDRATARGAGKADASEVLREVLDGWMSSG